MYRITNDDQLRAAFWLFDIFFHSLTPSPTNKQTLEELLSAIENYTAVRQSKNMPPFVFVGGETTADLGPVEYTNEDITKYVDTVRSSIRPTMTESGFIDLEAGESEVLDEITPIAADLKQNIKEQMIAQHKAFNDWVQKHNIKSHDDLLEYLQKNSGKGAADLIAARSLVKAAVIHYDMLRLLGENIDEQKYKYYRKLLEIENDDKFINEFLFLEPSTRGYSFKKYAVKTLTYGMSALTISMKVFTAFGLMLDTARGALTSTPAFFKQFLSYEIVTPNKIAVGSTLDGVAISAAAINAFDTLLTRGRTMFGYFNQRNLDVRRVQARTQFFAPPPSELSWAEYVAIKTGKVFSIPGVGYDAVTGAMGAVIATSILVGKESLGASGEVLVYLLGALSAGLSSFTFQWEPVGKNLEKFLKVLEQFYQEGRGNLGHNAWVTVEGIGATLGSLLLFFPSFMKSLAKIEKWLKDWDWLKGIGATGKGVTGLQYLLWAMFIGKFIMTLGGQITKEVEASKNNQAFFPGPSKQTLNKFFRVVVYALYAVGLINNLAVVFGATLGSSLFEMDHVTSKLTETLKDSASLSSTTSKTLLGMIRTLVTAISAFFTVMQAKVVQYFAEIPMFEAVNNGAESVQNAFTRLCACCAKNMEDLSEKTALLAEQKEGNIEEAEVEDIFKQLERVLNESTAAFDALEQLLMSRVQATTTAATQDNSDSVIIDFNNIAPEKDDNSDEEGAEFNPRADEAKSGYNSHGWNMV